MFSLVITDLSMALSAYACQDHDLQDLHYLARLCSCRQSALLWQTHHYRRRKSYAKMGTSLTRFDSPVILGQTSAGDYHLWSRPLLSHDCSSYSYHRCHHSQTSWAWALDQSAPPTFVCSCASLLSLWVSSRSQRWSSLCFSCAWRQRVSLRPEPYGLLVTSTPRSLRFFPMVWALRKSTRRPSTCSKRRKVTLWLSSTSEASLLRSGSIRLWSDRR